MRLTNLDIPLSEHMGSFHKTIISILAFLLAIELKFTFILQVYSLHFNVLL